ELKARYGRASRLGERSIGVPDAGSVSCRLLLTAMGDAIIGLLE
ncbi:DAK2 domain-containing protein, partial [Pectinatus haikarae]